MQKPDIVDFRSHKMIGGGLTGRNNARKMYSAGRKKSKYSSVCVGPEEMEAEDIAEAIAKKAKEAAKPEMDVDELAELTDKLRITRSRKAKAEEDSVMPSISIKSKSIKKKKGCVKSRRQMTF